MNAEQERAAINSLAKRGVISEGDRQTMLDRVGAQPGRTSTQSGSIRGGLRDDSTNVSPLLPLVDDEIDLDSRSIEYQEMGGDEAALADHIRKVGADLGALIDILKDCQSIDSAWLSDAEMMLKKGVMSLVRSVEKPAGF